VGGTVGGCSKHLRTFQPKEEPWINCTAALIGIPTNSVLVLVDEQEQVVFEKRIPNDLKKILLQLNPYHSLVHGLVVESTYN